MSDTLLIGYLTVLAYAVAFTYQWAYVGYFNVPTYFMDVSVNTIFVSLFVLVAFFILTRGALVLFESLGIIKNSFYGRHRTAEIVMIIFSLPGIMSGITNHDYKMIFILVGLIVFLELFKTIEVFYYGKGEKGFKNKIKKAEEIKDRKVPESNETPITNRILNNAFQISRHVPEDLAISSLFLCLIAYNTGSAVASAQTSFYVPSTMPNQIVITQFRDTLYTVTIDKDNRTFGKEIKLIDKTKLSEEGISLSSIKTGILRPAK